MIQTPLITSWAAGEISPKMYGRVDLDAYSKSAKTIENFLVIPQGALTKRPGTEYVGTTKQNTARLIPFVVSETESYLLELGNTGTTNGYIRYWRSGVYKGEVATTWTAEQVWELQYCQDNNGVYFAHENRRPAALIRTSTDNFGWGTIGYTYHAGDTEPFSTANNYPRAIAIFGGRFWFAGTINDPQRIWGSEAYGYAVAGGTLTVDMLEYTTYAYSYYQLTDPSGWSDPAVAERELVEEDRDITTADHLIDITIASDENDKIVWLAAGRHLVVGTTSSEWVIPKDISALSPRAEKMTDYGSTEIQARMAGEAVLMVQGDSKRVREYYYSQDIDGFTSPDLTLMADHIAGAGGFIEFSKQRNPYPLLYFVRSDGELAVLTYDKATQTRAWQRWTHADGSFKSVAVVKEGGADTVYVVVYRNTDYYIEKFAEVFPASQNDIVYMDSTYDAGAGGNTPTCAWLANETVSVVVDGVYEGTVVANGSGAINLTSYSGTQVWVGLAYTAKYQSMRSNAVAQSGSAHGKYKRVSSISMSVYRTLDVLVGFDTWTEANADTYAFGSTWETTTIEVPFDGDYDLEACVNIFSTRPLPCTITLMVAEVAA